MSEVMNHLNGEMQTPDGNATLSGGLLTTGIMKSRFLTTSSITVVTILAVLVMLNKLITASLDPREPPPLKSRVPMIGHLIGIIRYQAHYLPRLFASNSSYPIATLPILNGKMYAIYDAALIQSAYRNKNLSFVPFVIEFAQRELGYDDRCDKIVRESGIMDEFFGVIRDAMSQSNTQKMSANALVNIGDQLGNLGMSGGEWLDVPNVWIWARDFMTKATTHALYGPEDPLKKHPSFLQDTWIFENNLPMLLHNIFPSITARPAFQARKRIQAALSEYYSAHHDDNDEASQMVKNRANILRRYGIVGDEVGLFEIALLHVSTSNTIPTTFWLLAYLSTNPSLYARIRDEVSQVATRVPGTNDVILNMDNLAETCPLTVSSYRETIRLCNAAVGNRRVMEDTTISDGKGRSYFLREGVNVQMPAQVLHEATSVWGADAAEFVAERFIGQEEKLASDGVKAKRTSYVPFGGGKHLCPGRNFAFTENLGLLMTLALGFDAAPPKGVAAADFKVPEKADCSMAAAVYKPVNAGEGFGFRLRRREGWEETRWKYELGGKVKEATY